jgi:hypothetical protein
MTILRKLLVIVLFVSASYISNGQVAATPPMGWNSYNCFGLAVYEDEVKAIADYLAKNLKQYGWQFLGVDFL